MVNYGRKIWRVCALRAHQGLEVPGGSVGACEHGVGLVVTDEAFCGWVPLEFSAKQHSDVGEVAAGCGAVSDFHRADGLLAGADAVEEVLLVVVALVEVDGIGGQNRVRIFRRVGEDAASIDVERALFAMEDYLALACLATDLDAVGVAEAEVNGLCSGEKLLRLGIFPLAPHGDGT